MHSWRDSTKSQYIVYIKKFLDFLHEQGASSPDLNTGLTFLTTLFNQGCSYHQIVSARSALSSLIDLHNATGITFGHHPLVKRFVKGVFEMRPVFTKYRSVWDVRLLFDYFRNLDHATNATLKLLGKKLALLIAVLSGGQRIQTLHAINVLDIKILPGKCVIPIYDKLKQTRPKHHLKPLEFPVYLREPKLCVVQTLKDYLEVTRPFRKHSKLFLSYHQPHAPVTKDTIARWCKELMHGAGINTNVYSSHSSRSAATSYLDVIKGVSLKDICAIENFNVMDTILC